MKRDEEKRAPILPYVGQPPAQPEMPSFLVPPKCEACKDTGEVEARVQYHTKRGRSCQMEKRPCPFCENGADMDRKQIPATK